MAVIIPSIPRFPNPPGTRTPSAPSSSLSRALFLDLLGIDEAEVHPAVIGDPAVVEGLVEALVGVGQIDVFSDDRDRHLMGGVERPFDHVLPRPEVGPAGPDVQEVDDLLIHPLAVIDQRNLVDAGDVLGGEDRRHLHIAEEGDLGLDRVGEKVLRPAEKDVRLDADLPEGLDAVLRRFRLDLARRLDEGDPGQVDEDRVLPPDLVAELADRLQEGKALDVAHGAADLDDRHIEAVGGLLDVILDLVRDVGDHLNGLSQVVAPPLLGNHREIDLPRREVVPLAHPGTGKALVVAEVEVGLRAVVGHEDLAVLEGAHRPRIDVDVGVELLVGHPEASALQNGRDGRRRQPLAEGGENAARHKYEFRLHGCSLFRFAPAVPGRGNAEAQSSALICPRSPDLPGDHLDRFAQKNAEGDLPETTVVPRQVEFLDEIPDIVDPLAQEIFPLLYRERLVKRHMDQQEMPDLFSSPSSGMITTEAPSDLPCPT